MTDISLVPFEQADIPLLESWLTDAELIFKWTAHRFTYPLNKDEFISFMKEAENEFTRGYFFKVIDENNKHPFGYIELNPINEFCLSVNICRVLIGDLAYRGKSLAKLMVNEVLRYAFEKENLHRVELTVNYDNYHAIKTYESVGMKKEVTLRKYLNFNGTLYDIFVMSILEHEWRALNPE